MKDNRIANQSRSAKKTLVTGGPVSRPWIIPMLIAVLIVAGAAGAGFYLTRSPKLAQAAVGVADAGAADASIDTIRYPLADFSNGKARFFKWNQDGVTIKYFILKSSDGTVRAAFDACDVCWRAAKGYTQEGDYMVCRNCGRQFSSVLINEVKGGCNPAPLKRTIEGDHLIIRTRDIAAGREYFNFKGKAAT